jgi:hypothetical protein
VKPEGNGHFFGADTFDPGAPMDYLARVRIRASAADLAAFSAANA